MADFRGKINISRDLRKNKQVVIGRFDTTDIVFLSLGIGVGIFIAFLLGFLLRVIDEFVAIFIGFIPTIVIITLGFMKIANIRCITYLMMKKIDKKGTYRVNASNFQNTVDKKLYKKNVVKAKNNSATVNDTKNIDKIKINIIDCLKSTLC